MSNREERAAAPSHPPLLIMGSPRSGTTFVSSTINRYFDVHICRDNGTMLRFHRNLARYEPLAEDGNLRRLIAHMYQDYFVRTRLRQRGLNLSEAELFKRVRRRSFGGVVEAIFLAVAETHGKQSFGYKRASFARVDGARLDDLFPGARCVHIIRDARDVVLSMHATRHALLERSWHFAALDWVSHVQTGRRIGQMLGPERYLEIRYEDLMAQPVEMLTRILAFRGEAHDDGERRRRIAAEIGEQLKSDNTQKWRRLMPARAVQTVERVAGPLLAELGYGVAYPEWSGAAISWPERLWLHADRVVRNAVMTHIGVTVRHRSAMVATQLRMMLMGRGAPPSRAR